MPTALEGTKAVIFAFNLIQKASLISIKRWYKDARKLNKVFKPILVGTKYIIDSQKDNPYKCEIAKMARAYADNMHSPLIMCSSKTSIHVKQVFTIVVGSVFQIKIKSKQKHDEEDEPILEYGIIYKTKKKKDAKTKERKRERKDAKTKEKKRKRKDKKRKNKKHSHHSHHNHHNNHHKSSSDEQEHQSDSTVCENSDQDDEKVNYPFFFFVFVSQIRTKHV